MHKSESSDLSFSDLAAITGLTRQTLFLKAQAGDLPGVYRIGRIWRFRREDLPKLRGVASADVKGGDACN